MKSEDLERDTMPEEGYGMREWMRKKRAYGVILLLFWLLQGCLVVCRVMRTQSFLQVNSQTGPAWNTYQQWMKLDNLMGNLQMDTYLVFLVLAVLMVQRLVSVKAMLLTLAACYGGSWILAALAPLWGGAGVWNYGIELFHSFANAAAVVAIGFLVMLLTRKRFGRQGKDHSTDITGR